MSILIVKSMCVSTLVLAGINSAWSEEIPQIDLKTERFRRPQSICWIEPGQFAVVANRRGKSVTLVDIQNQSVEAEYAFDEEVLDVATLKRVDVINNEPCLLILKKSEILLTFRKSGRMFLGQRVGLSGLPAELAVANSGGEVAVSSVWNRCVWLFNVSTTPVTGKQSLPVLKSAARVDLPFEPRSLAFSPNGKSLVAVDAFGGQLASIDPIAKKVVGLGMFHGHNAGDIQFLTTTRFLLTHQILHADGATTVENIAAGRVIENVYEEIELEDIEGEIQFVPRVVGEMGEPSHGAADPAGAALSSTGERFVALSGVDEVLFANKYGVNTDLAAVGDRPLQLLLTPDESILLCLNGLDESISIIEMVGKKVTGTISLGLTPLDSPRERGEKLFYDAHRSRFGWFSCQSCHVGGHTNEFLADTFSDGSSGAPKRVLSLLGGRDNNPWAWNGSQRSLHDQVRKSGETTMRGDGFHARETNDLVAFLHTLESPPPFHPPQTADEHAQVNHGRQLFSRWGCARCHVPSLTYTSDAVYDVGLVDESGQKKFNPPSLIGVGYRNRLFHDGRARSLKEVFIDHGHQLNDAVAEDDLNDLISFLESL